MYIYCIDIGSCFSPKNHPDVKSGRISVNSYTNDFFESFGRSDYKYFCSVAMDSYMDTKLDIYMYVCVYRYYCI